MNINNLIIFLDAALHCAERACPGCKKLFKISNCPMRMSNICSESERLLAALEQLRDGTGDETISEEEIIGLLKGS